MKINWKQKLSSRKMWAAIVGFTTAALTAFNVSNLTIEQVAAVVTAAGTLVAYILSEGMVDAAREKKESNDDKTE